MYNAQKDRKWNFIIALFWIQAIKWVVAEATAISFEFMQNIKFS